MDMPEDLEIKEGFAQFSPNIRVSMEEAAALVTRAITLCRERQIRKLLIDTTRLTGFPPPPIATRYWFIQEWARAAQGMVVVAMVAFPEYIDPQRFGVIAAANAGLKANIFSSESEAVSWLLSN